MGKHQKRRLVPQGFDSPRLHLSHSERFVFFGLDRDIKVRF